MIETAIIVLVILAFVTIRNYKSAKYWESAFDNAFKALEQREDEVRVRDALLQQRVDQIRQRDSQIEQLNAQIESQIAAATGTVEDVLEVLPGIEGDFGMRALVRKLICELNDARQELKGARDAAALERVDSVGLVERIKHLSNQAAHFGAICDILGVPDMTGQAVVKRMSEYRESLNTLTENLLRASLAMREVRQWVGARPNEPLLDATKRMVLTLESDPGAPKELLNIRNTLGIGPAESVLKTIQEPMDFEVVVTRRKGKMVGATVQPSRCWPSVGEVGFDIRDA